MKNRKRMINIREQSTERALSENLWFFSENSVLNESPVHEKKSGKGDNLRMVHENYDPFMLKPSERNKLKKECTFVVDWQLADSL